MPNLWLLNGGIVVALVLGTLIGGIAAYNGTPYTIDRANGFVDLAAATNNLTETVADLNQTLAILEPFHGNPNPVFATSHTDYDLVKKQISTTIQAALAVLPLGPSSFAYQQALKNIQSDLTTTVEGELHDISGAILFWSFGIWAIIAWIVGVAVIVVASIVWGDF